jgi:hypothetical protein
MIKLRSLINEGLKSVKAITPDVMKKLVAAAQKIYDEWDQTPETDELNGGGICHLIADELAGILSSHGVECQTVSSNYEQHVYLVARFREGIYLIDIPYDYYERGAAFTWTKLPNIVFDDSHVVIRRLDADHRKFSTYIDEVKKLCEMEYPMAKGDDVQSYAGYEGWKGKVIWMSPDKFLKLASPLLDPVDYTLKDLEAKMKNNTPIDFLMLRVDPERNKIIGHEGRHRATVAKKLGIEKVPVLILVHIWDKRVPHWGKKEHDYVDNADWKPEWDNPAYGKIG